MKFVLIRETMFVKVALRDAKVVSTKSVSSCKKLLTTQVENLEAISHFKTKHLVLWTSPKTLKTQRKNRLKEVGIRSGLTLTKVELSCVKCFHASVSSLSCLSHRCKQWQEKMGDWIGNFWLVWKRTIRSESTQDKAGSLPPASRDYVMLFVIFLKS